LRAALGIFKRAQGKFKLLTVTDPLFKPKIQGAGRVLTNMLTIERLARAQGRHGGCFVEHLTQNGIQDLMVNLFFLNHSQSGLCLIQSKQIL
jgi:hypothetical protein